MYSATPNIIGSAAAPRLRPPSSGDVIAYGPAGFTWFWLAGFTWPWLAGKGSGTACLPVRIWPMWPG
jgi:hypothetical protein